MFSFLLLYWLMNAYNVILGSTFIQSDVIGWMHPLFAQRLLSLAAAFVLCLLATAHTNIIHNTNTGSATFCHYNPQRSKHREARNYYVFFNTMHLQIQILLFVKLTLKTDLAPWKLQDLEMNSGGAYGSTPSDPYELKDPWATDTPQAEPPLKYPANPSSLVYDTQPPAQPQMWGTVSYYTYWYFLWK